MTDRQFRILSVLLIFLGSCAIYYATSLSPWGYSDAVVYLVTARYLSSGRGLVYITPSGRLAPVSLSPPLYPLLISIAGPTLEKALLLARWVGIISFAFLLGIIIFSTYRIGRSRTLALTLGALTLGSYIFLHLFSGVMTESLFTLFFISALLALTWALCSEEKGWLILGAGLTALALLTRYAGFPLIGTGVLAFLFFGRNNLVRRLWQGSLFAMLSFGPSAVWLLYLRVTFQGLGPRQFVLPEKPLWVALQPFRVAFVESLWSLIPFPARWARQNYDLHLMILVLVGLALSVLVGSGWLPAVRRSTPYDNGLRLLVTIFFIFGIGYTIFLAASFLFAYPTLDINSRMLMPLLLAFWLCSGGSLFLLSRSHPVLRPLHYLFLVLGLLIVLGSIPGDVKLLDHLHNEGEGYTGVEWRNSALVNLVRELPPNLPIISNETAVLLLYTDRVAYGIPELIQHIHKTSFTRFGDELDDPVQKVFREEGAALVLFKIVSGQLDPIYYKEAPKRLAALTGGLYLAQEVSDGWIYYYK